MRTKFLAFGIFAFAALGTAARAQGSWLPYGTIGASDVAVSPAGVVWLIGKEPRSIRSTLVLGETRFFTPAGMPAHVAVDLNGFPWLLNTDASVWHFSRNSAGKEEWVQSSLKAIDIAVGSTGEVWAIDTDQHIEHLKDGAWESIGGAGQKIAVDPSGNPWVVNAAGQISHWTGNSWAQIPGTATDISVGPDGSVFILGTTRVRGGFEVLRLNGNEWEHIAGGGGIAISAGSKSVFLAQDTTTNLVLSSATSSIRVATPAEFATSTNSATSQTAQADAPANTGAATSALASAGASAATSTVVASGQTSVPSTSGGTQPEKPDGGTTKDASAGGSGASIPHPSAGTVVGALGALGGFLGRAAPAVIPAIPNPNAVAQAAAGAAAGAVAGEAVGAAGNLAGKAVSSVVSSGASSAAPSAATSEAASAPPSAAQSAPQSAAQGAPPSAAQGAPQKISAPELAHISIPQSPWKLPMPGSLRCPIIGGGATMEHGCEMVGRAAMQLWKAPSAECSAPAFSDSRNGGECWTCPAEFTRGSTPVDAADACVGPASQHSVATLVSGCATSQTPPGYGTAFRDSQNGGQCFACPLPLQRSWSTVASLTKGNLSACFGKAKQLLVWQLGQFPEVGTYHFMPGLLSIALADPKAVDTYLEQRALGDTAKKREMWAQMIADPSGSAELKALLFASLLSVAKKDSVSADATSALHEFESYVQARRTYVANEALRMYSKAREVDSLYKQVKDSASGIRSAAVQTAAADFKTYAWSSVVPDSAGTAFIVASAALAQLGASGGPPGSLDSAASSLNVRYLVPVTKALSDRLTTLQTSHAEMIQKADSLTVLAHDFGILKGADPSMISTTLLGSAMKASNGVMTLLSKGKVAAEYAKYVKDMSVPVRVRSLLDSTNPDDQQTLLLYWALATSAHTAGDKIGEGALTGADLCNSDSWTAAECSSAKSMVLAAAKVAGYSN